MRDKLIFSIVLFSKEILQQFSGGVKISGCVFFFNWRGWLKYFGLNNV